MKYIRLIYILIIPICILFNACENDQNGFTNKAEAKNELINGLKEGKWVEYNIVDTQGVKNGVHHFGDTLSYDLEIYQVGQLNGISNRFDRSGKLRSQVTYVNGKKNGISKLYQWYNGDKVILSETPYSDDKINGTKKMYYVSNKIAVEIPYSDGKINGIAKVYYEKSGKLKSTIVYNNDVKGETKNYDETGKEIK